MPENINMSAVAYREGDVWIVQGIDYDIVAHAHDVAALPFAFSRAVMENICITQDLGREPLQGVPPAPSKFQQLFDDATVGIVEIPATQPQAGRPVVSYRLAG